VAELVRTKIIGLEIKYLIKDIKNREGEGVAVFAKCVKGKDKEVSSANYILRKFFNILHLKV
jgi:uncharacterized protein YbcI